MDTVITARPNVIWIFGDQHRAQAVGYAGDPNVHTPNIDRLAAEGLTFTGAVGGCPLCSPYRGALLSGRYPHNSVPGHEQQLPPAQPTIAHAFNEAGYHTAYFGKWHVDGFHERDGRAAMHIVPPERRGGFQQWVGYENNNSQWDCWVHGGAGDDAFHRPLPGYETDALTESVIDLSDALGGQFGHLIVMVDDPNMPGLVQRNSPLPQRIVTWVQATQIGLDAFSDSDELVVWATDLGTGAPLADVAVRFSDNDKPVTTNADGLATLQLTQDGAPLLLGERGQDLAILPSNFYYWDEHSWAQRPLRDTLSWYVFDDRGMYRPGETVHVKGWLRQIGAGPQGDVMLPATDGLSVRYQLIDSRGNELGGDVVPVTELAGFDFAIDLPANINLGYATLYLTAQGASDVDGLTYGHGFQVQEFRRPEFEVTAQVEGEGPFFLGESATVTARAAYFAGGPLPNAPADWTVTATPGQYSPPGWPDFIFGQWMPWWGFYGGDQGSASTVTYTGRTDSGGEHLLQMDFVDAEKPQPYSVRADASVTDLNRQVWNASATLLVHPADRYVGLRSARNFVEQGEPLEVDAIVTDVDGAAQSGVEVALRAARLAWEYQGDAWTEVEQDVQECNVTSGADPVRCTFTTEVGGEYRITAEVRDAQDRLNRTEMTLWVSGGARPPQRNVDQEEVILVPDKESYQPGDVAEVLVQAPFAPAEGLLTVARSGILYTERFVTDDGSATLRIPIEDAHIPNLSIQVDLTGSAPRVDDQGQPVDGAPPRPAYAVGRLDLPVPPLNRTLGLTITPQADELEPGASTAVEVALTDAGGAPVADAELAVVVVDEAILALTNYTLADPLAVFYPPR
ncbi:MAG: sulfatase-like hydrolase/transferase, partial [Caldilineaceae bacterium]|nr:sulfatase-like hydrolase/transferase [Caldilineaceae bacterium]